MQYPKYDTLFVSPEYTVYTFVSSGPKGNFEVIVAFTPIEETNYYNLGFGASDNDRKIDDTIILNNGDRNIILATVAGFVDEFLSKYPDATVSFSGSTPTRTRLYRRAISINYTELQFKFSIFGLPDNELLVLEPFNPLNNYIAFFVQKRITFEL